MQQNDSRRGRLWLAAWLAICLLPAPPASGFIITPGFVPWTSSAVSSRTANGQPTTITWGFARDGSTISSNTLLAEPQASDLIGFLDTNFGTGLGGTDLTQRPWFTYFEQSFGRWEELSGISYIYEPNDDGGSHSTKSGVEGVRADVRIGGTGIDGDGGTLGYNFFPPGVNGNVVTPQGGDMVLDTDDITFYTNSSNNFLRLRQVVMHEHGHGMSLEHLESNTDNLLMEPFINLSFDGPQLDDIRGIQFFYGDPYEKTNNGLGNGTAALASPLGSLLPGGSLAVGADANVPTQRIEPTATDFVSLANLADTDFYSFTTSGPMALDAVLTPRGGVFTQASEGQTPTTFNANARVDLELTLFDSNGVSVLGSSDVVGLGGVESLTGLILPDAGEYFVRVSGGTDTVQLYELGLAGTALLEADFDTDGDVDASDLTRWQSGFGVNSLGDADGDLDTDLADLVVWQQHFGQGLSGLAAVSAVPEPGSLAMLVCGAFGLARRGRRSG